ncbi:adenylate/guanylate cyclase domain-containing protein [Aurantimonas sp. A2-1-M11]|uniref:adenylate/guanylate cyclase domain-containing protein n=1 Tax=Aurantimonas sp. A2-1-M11 TaxID=3113712 RepID=UPI002F93A492
MEPICSAGPADACEAGNWPIHRTRLLDWLVRETRDMRFIDDIFQQLCDRLRAGGPPVARATVHFRIHHPQWLGARILWRAGAPDADIQTYQHGAMETAEYLDSPIAAVHGGASQVRLRLSREPAAADEYSLFGELRAEGMTDYVAWPLEHTLGRRHVVSFASDDPAGFSDADLGFLADLLPAFALVSEIRLKNRLARTLLETYVGPHASDQILAGAITRGSGTTVAAAIMVCDLRDFTRISELWPRDDVIELLNGYFDAVCEPIERHGGEILKFIGDGLLAIFPLDRPTACDDLLKALAEAQQAMNVLNEGHVRAGREPLRYGVGIHVGDVMYGNIGSRSRLDFTVIGPAVNAAARLENLTKTVKRPVLLSRAFADRASCSSALESLGAFPLRGLGEEMEVFAFSATAARGPVPTGRACRSTSRSSLDAR